MYLKIFILVLPIAFVNGQLFEDRRCNCICPSPSSVFNTSKSNRQIYNGNVPPNKCNCESVILPIIWREVEGREHIFCPRCDCIYQTRNTTLIMGVVFMLLVVIAVMLLYKFIHTLLSLMVGRKRERMLEEAKLLSWEDPELN